MKMETQYYIIAVSAKGILPKDEGEYKNRVIAPIEKTFGPIQEISGAQWYLSAGINEKIYHATTPQFSPEREREFKETILKNLKEAIESTKRNFKIFKLEEVMINQDLNTPKGEKEF